VLGLGLAFRFRVQVCPFFHKYRILILFLSRPDPDPIAEPATIPNLFTGDLDMKLFADEVFPVLDELS
jgi:hypothetical protein